MSTARRVPARGAPARLAYEVVCDTEGRTSEGSVTGCLGARSVELRVARAPRGEWMLNGKAVSNLAGCVDLDLGFTPATNPLQLRRIGLEVGEAAADRRRTARAESRPGP
ncbi:MAG TPA: putative glycolipid-binding domain-containing protein [Polyangiaceae bacterium]